MPPFYVYSIVGKTVGRMSLKYENPYSRKKG